MNTTARSKTGGCKCNYIEEKN